MRFIWQSCSFFSGFAWEWSSFSNGFTDSDRKSTMDGIYLLGAAVSAVLFVYLVIALLKPEWFA
jgi:K+-transporting ATPase KdpF subunit